MTVEEFKELKAGDRIVALKDTYFKTKDVYGTVIKRFSAVKAKSIIIIGIPDAICRLFNY